MNDIDRDFDLTFASPSIPKYHSGGQHRSDRGVHMRTRNGHDEDIMLDAIGLQFFLLSGWDGLTASCMILT